MIDTHAHVHSRAFDSDRAEVLARAWESGVTALLEVNIDVEGWGAAQATVALDPRIFGAVGIHPHDTARATLAEFEAMTSDLTAPWLRAIGETGLDYYRDYAPSEIQQQFFARHVGLARDSGLPLVVHVREKPEGPSAHDDALRILEEEGRGQVRGVLHCFSGDLHVARRAHALGFRLGIGGAHTYAPKKAGPLLVAIAQELGLGMFVLETDCPYLTPHPHRNARNEPANVSLTAAVLAGYLGLPVAEVERSTDGEARTLFSLPGV